LAVVAVAAAVVVVVVVVGVYCWNSGFCDEEAELPRRGVRSFSARIHASSPLPWPKSSHNRLGFPGGLPAHMEEVALAGGQHCQL
jgi:hypothetical protein